MALIAGFDIRYGRIGWCLWDQRRECVENIGIYDFQCKSERLDGFFYIEITDWVTGVIKNNPVAMIAYVEEIKPSRREISNVAIIKMERYFGLTSRLKEVAAREGLQIGGARAHEIGAFAVQGKNRGPVSNKDILASAFPFLGRESEDTVEVFALHVARLFGFAKGHMIIDL